MRISDWSSDVCSSDLSIYSFQRADPAEFQRLRDLFRERARRARHRWRPVSLAVSFRSTEAVLQCVDAVFAAPAAQDGVLFGEAEIRHRAKRVGEAGLVEMWPPAPPAATAGDEPWALPLPRSEEHTSELPSLMRHPYAVF